jgi:hypothetical protein
VNAKKLLALWGLKWNPFSPDLPSEALLVTAQVEHFAWRVEQLVQEGGFALIRGESGTGKSVALRIVAERLAALRDVVVGVLERPRSKTADFYRELGEIFSVKLSPSNRYGGFKALRERWRAHLSATRIKPVLLIDEAQEMAPEVAPQVFENLAGTRLGLERRHWHALPGEIRRAPTGTGADLPGRRRLTHRAATRRRHGPAARPGTAPGRHLRHHRLHGIDENSASEVAELLAFIRSLQRQLDLSVILVHHTRKNAPGGAAAGQALRGSGDQWYGACPLHGSSSGRARHFSVNVAKRRYCCHKCRSQGNQLELWATFTKTQLHPAMIELCHALGRDVPWIRRW